MTTKSMVRSFLEPSPAIEYTLERRTENGKELFPFGCRVLRQAQLDEALAAAQKYAENMGEREGKSDIYLQAQTIEVLLRCIVQPGGPVDMPDGTRAHRPYFITAEQLRTALSPDEIAQLMTAHYLTDAHFGMDRLDEKKVEELIEGLAKEMTGPYFLSRVDSSDWPLLIYTLARLAQSWRPPRNPTRSSSPSSSESDLSSSESGTTGALPRLSGQLEPSSKSIEIDEQLTRAQARGVAKS